MKTALVTAFASTALLASVPALAAPTVTNGSFENPTVNTSPSYGDPADMFAGGAGIEPNGGAFGYADAPDGTHVAHIQQGGVVTLQVNGLTPGTEYSVNFMAAARPGYATLPVSVAFDGVTIGSFTATSTSFSSFAYNFLFPNIDSNQGSITFTGGLGAGDLNAAIDNVTIAGAVPEPATWAMMLVGFGMVGAGLRYRRRSTAARLA